jgi:hypothetical protein
VAPPGRSHVSAFVGSGRSPSILSCSSVRFVLEKNRIVFGRRAKTLWKSDIARSDRLGVERRFQMVELSLPVISENGEEGLAYVNRGWARRAGTMAILLLRKDRGEWRVTGEMVLAWA